MAKITGILCEIITGNVEDAGTDGDIYLGFGGREFHLDSSENDFQRGSYRDYLLGAPPTIPGPGPPQQVQVRNKDKNDPRKGFHLDTNKLSGTPVYIRFEPQFPDDHWNLHFAAVLVYAPQFVIGYSPQGGYDELWLGHSSGKILYLTLEHATEGVKLLDLVRKKAAEMGK